MLFSLLAVSAQEDAPNQTEIPANGTISENQTAPEQPPEENATPPEDIVVDFKVTGFMPAKAKIGDVVLNIQVENTGNVVLKNVMAIVTGTGFSTYDVTPISRLEPGEKSSMYIMGNFREDGNIPLIVKIGEKVFYLEVQVENPAAIEASKQKEAEEQKKKAIEGISKQFDELKRNYTQLEQDYYAKKNDYDLSEVNLKDMDEYIKDTKSSLLAGSANQANISLELALDEYRDQKEKLDNAPKKPFLQKIKENIGLISAIAGSIITLVTLYELMKRKQEKLYTKLKEARVKKQQGTEKAGKAERKGKKKTKKRQKRAIKHKKAK